MDDPTIWNDRLKVGFYTYGNPTMGMGHVFRCLALAEAWLGNRTQDELVFELVDFSEGLHAVHAWQKEKPSARVRVNRWKQSEPPRGEWDVLFVDQLSVPVALLSELSASARCLVSFDDTSEARWVADIAVNALYRANARRPSGSQTIDLSGLEYLIMNPRVRELSRTPRSGSPEIKRLFVSQGGADTFGVVPKLIGALAPTLRARPRVEIHVHIGPAFRHRSELSAATAAFAGTLQVHENTSDLISLMHGMDVAVCAGGIMAFELATLGVAVVTVSAEEKELESMSELESRGCVRNLGRFAPDEFERNRGVIEELLDRDGARSALRATALRWLDGQGADRVIEAVLTRMNSGNSASNSRSELD